VFITDQALRVVEGYNDGCVEAEGLGRQGRRNGDVADDTRGQHHA
jgi:hypothetical protein